ncbi:LysR family transcriptional regulator [Pseudoalteromonas denitrificans]|uniref:Transcriptional regulator, LysR family n=1 Tax=Pseudoalteromonas denitrificans DSM 6059 TaxID=1123010 RepID=A0A1I1V267_9GAMM|nr:LysR family transcriptional regulator [Pseudoalteromonas denitrificans]SFD77162.1 transcriptional regulator, LysR family [Pseudoalteromonas denitrificans DSM 6059]
MRTFLVVVEKLSFSGASNQLNLAVSAVSRQVAELEEHFKCQLLYRTTRSMKVTSDGVYFVEQFRALLSQLDNLEFHADNRLQIIRGELTITSPNNSSELGISTLISEFLKLYPEVRISWQQLNRYTNLVDEGIDLAFRVGELPDSSLVARKFKELEVLFVASPEYLKVHGIPSHPKDLVQHACIIELSTKQPWRWRYQENQQTLYINVKGKIEVNQGELCAKLAADGHGIIQIPKFMIQTYLNNKELIPILESYQVNPLNMSLVYSPSRLINPALKGFIDFALNQR